MPKLKFTPRSMQVAVCPTEKKRIVYSDSTTKGLTLEVRANGGKTYYVRYIDAYGAQRNYRIGDPSSVTLDAARQRTIEISSKVAVGEDPKEEKRRKQAVPTVSQFASERYLPFVQGYKRSWKCDETLLRLHILPALGTRRMDSVTNGDITSLHHGLKGKGYAPGTCNRILILVRYLFNLAIKWGIEGVTKNPSRHVDLFKVDNKRQRFLTREEVNLLFEALKQSENPCLYYIVSFLLMTGARKQEALKAAWKDIDFDKGFWLIPDTKSGSPRPVPISNLLFALLDTLPSKGRLPWLFPNPKTGKPYVSVFSTWNTARKKAGLKDVRMHDLRHSFASFLVNSGRSLYEVQKLLGHANIKTTERYAHLSNKTLTEAVNTVGDFLTIEPFEPRRTINGTALRIAPKRSQTAESRF